MHPTRLLTKSTVNEKSLAPRSRQCSKAFTIDNFRIMGIIYMRAKTCQDTRAYLLMTNRDTGEAKLNMRVEVASGEVVLRCGYVQMFLKMPTCEVKYQDERMNDGKEKMEKGVRV